MKINEKNLCSYACTQPSDMEGFLSKRGEVNKSFQRRWFVLKGNLLFYFEKKTDKEPLGMIIMEGCTIELAEDSELYCFHIIFHGTNSRCYILSADSQEVLERWMKALTCASYDYMKLMVQELQRQLDEIDGAQGQTPENTPTVAPKPPPRRQNPFNKPVLVENGASGVDKVTKADDPGSSRRPPAPSKPSTSAADTNKHQSLNFDQIHEALGQHWINAKNDKKPGESSQSGDTPIVEV